jgi:integrase
MRKPSHDDTAKTKPATGTAEWLPTKGGRYVARISVPGAMSRIREEMLDEQGQPLFTNKAKDKTAAQRWAREFSSAVRDTSAPMPDRVRLETKVAAFGAEWTSGRLYRKHGEVKRLKIKKSADDDVRRLEQHVYPYLGQMTVAAVTEENVEQAFAKAWVAYKKRYGKEPSQGTKRQVYMVTHRLFDLSIRPGRLRKDNPVTDDLLPSKGRSKIYSYLYPSELLLLLKCVAIPIERRVYYALATYTGLRKGSIRVNAQKKDDDDDSDFQLENYLWSSIDLKHFTIMSLVNKNDAPQMFAQSDFELVGVASLIELLRRWREYCGWPSDSTPVIKTLYCKRKAEAEALRKDLLCAGVHRGVLFNNTDKIQALRFHDLRATFVTWAKRAGKGDGWITDRTGHITKEIMDRYNRAARSLADLNLDPGPFPDISCAIPELAEINVTRLSKRFSG